METAAGADAGVRRALIGAFAAAAGGVGTEHLLLGLVGTGGGEAGRILDEFGVTVVPLTDVLRQRRWTVTDEAAEGEDTGPLGDLEWRPGKQRRPMNYTGAARAAMHRAIAAAAADGRTEFHRGDLLDALLAAATATAATAATTVAATAPNRAVEVLERCGVDPARVRERLAGGDPVEPVDVAPDLQPTVDHVLGRTRYEAAPFTRRVALGLLQAAGANLARTPVPWADLEARDQAARLGHRKVGTAHLLLALLAMHEVTQVLPHLVVDVADRYLGARTLAGTGLTYAATRAALAAEAPGRDPRRYKSYVDARRDTTSLLAGILDGNTSAARLLAALGVSNPLAS
jgi:hypothetical protein